MDKQLNQQNSDPGTQVRQEPRISKVSVLDAASEIEIRGFGFGEASGLVRVLVLESQESMPSFQVLGWSANCVLVQTSAAEYRGILLLETADGRISNSVSVNRRAFGRERGANSGL